MSESPPSPLALAFEAFQAADLQTAKDLASEVLQREPRNLRALNLLSIIALSMGDYRAHVHYLLRILAVAPNHAPTMITLANMRRAEGKLTEATELARRAIEIAPNYPNAYNTLGLCQQLLENYEQAAECFSYAIRLNPEIGALYINLGVALQYLGKWEEALATYRKAEELTPEIPEIYEAIAHICSHQKRRREAIRNFEKALSITPESPTRLLQLADAKAMGGETEESFALVLRALEVDPNLAEAHYMQGLRLQEQGDFEEAKAAFIRSIDLQPQQGGAYLGLVTNARVTEEHLPYIEAIRSLIRADRLPVNPMILLHTALGKAFDDLGDYEQAIKEVDEANRLELAKGNGVSQFDIEKFSTYVDSIIKRFPAEYFAAHQGLALDSELPIFIVGLPRSGTTLTEQILSSHPEVSAAGEQLFWTEVDTEEKIVALADNQERSRELGEAYLEKMRRREPNARFVTDKRPDNFLFVGYLHALFPNARFILCERDIKDNAVSLYLTPYRTRPPFTQTREGIVAYIEQYRRLMDHWRKVLPSGTLLEISYEETVGDQEAITSRILAFCDLPWNDTCLRPEENRRTVATPSNWQTRQAVYNGSVERWKRYEPWIGALANV
jgi:tetratricopeptide (TPR) repeat protein